MADFRFFGGFYTFLDVKKDAEEWPVRETNHRPPSSDVFFDVIF